VMRRVVFNLLPFAFERDPQSGKRYAGSRAAVWTRLAREERSGLESARDSSIVVRSTVRARS
jgi:hypothetical protein